jgi:hypothetical protein
MGLHPRRIHRSGMPFAVHKFIVSNLRHAGKCMVQNGCLAISLVAERPSSVGDWTASFPLRI